jgi:hypothetical protein
MPVLEFTWATSLPLLIAVTALLATLGLSVPAAFREGAALREAQAQGVFMDVIRTDLVRASKRRELMRVCKHLVIVSGIGITFIDVGNVNAAMLRNCAFALVAILMLTNTMLDYRVKKKALRYLAERN